MPDESSLLERIGKANTKEPAASDNDKAIEALRALCVETNILSRLADLHDTHLVLLHSDTNEGRLVASSLQASLTLSSHRDQWLHLDAGHVQTVESTGLDVRKEQELDSALRGYIRTLTKLITTLKSRSSSLTVCATGGYKVQAAYAYVVALLHNVKTSYLFEKYDRDIVLPLLPLRADLERVWMGVSPRILCQLHRCDDPTHGLPPKQFNEYKELLTPFVERVVGDRYRVNVLGEALLSAQVYQQIRPQSDGTVTLKRAGKEGNTPPDVMQWAVEHLASFKGAVHVQVADWLKGNQLTVGSITRQIGETVNPWTVAVYVPTTKGSKTNMLVKCIVRLQAQCEGEARAVRDWLCEHLGSRRENHHQYGRDFPSPGGDGPRD